MSDSKQKQLQLNQRTLDANNKLKDITRTANATVEIMDNTNRVLDDQGQKIQRNIELNDEIKNNLMITKKKTEEMRRRNICIKISMYIAILALFAANVVSIIVKVSGKTGTKT